MRNGPTPLPQDTSEEILALVHQLHETEHRLQELTGGGVDSVMNTGGDSYMLRHAQERLRQNETMLRMAGRTARMGGWNVDLLDSRVTWSDEVCAIHEVPGGTLPTLDEAFDFYAPEWREVVRKAFESCVRDSVPFDLEAILITAKGNRVWVHAMGDAVHDPYRVVTAVQGALQDITEQKSAEVKLLQSEMAQRALAATQASILNAISPHIALLDREGVIMSVNDRWRRFSGHRGLKVQATGVGQNYLEVCQHATGEGAPEAHKAAAGIRAVLTGETAEFTFEYPCSTPAEQLWFLMRVVRVEVKRLQGAVIAHENITPRKLAEFRMNRVNRLHTVLSKVSEAIVQVRDREELYDAVCRIMVEDGLLCLAFIAELDTDGERARPVASHGAGREFLSQPMCVVPLDGSALSQGTVGTALRTGAPDYCNDIGAAPRMRPWLENASKYGLRATASFPLIRSGTPIGALVLYAGEKDYFLEDEIRLMVTVATNLSVALEALTKEQQRQQAENALRASEANMTAAQRIAHFGSWELDLADAPLSDANALRWSDEMYRIAGYEPGAVAVSYELFLRLIPLDERAQVQSFVADAIRDRREHSIVHRLVWPNGEVRFVQEIAQAFYDRQTGRPQRIVGTAHDITERRKAEDAMREGSKFTNDVLNSITAHLVVLDNHGVIVAVNDAWRRFGRENGVLATDFLGHNYLDVCRARAIGHNEEGADEAAEGIVGVLQGRCAEFEIEYPCDSPTEKRWFRMRAVPLSGERRGAVVLHMDVTGRKQNEEELRRSEEQFRGMFDAAATGIAISTPEGRFLQANAAYCRMLGYTEAELKERNFATLTHPDDLVLNLKLRDELLAGKRDSFVMEKRYLRKDGGTVWTRHSVSAVRAEGGEVVTFIVVAEDSTERKRVETRLRRLLDSNVQAVIFWNKKGEITGCNDSFLRLVRYTREDLEAGRMNWVAMTPPEYAEGDKRALNELATTGVCAPYEKVFICKDGKRVPILIGAAVFEDNPDEGVCFALDLTERKGLEEQIQQAQKMEAIGTLAGGIAHDFNNVLTAINGYTELARMYLKDNPDVREFLDSVLQASRRAADLVRQILTFSRNERTERRHIPLRPVVEEAFKLLRASIPSTIEFELILAPDVPDVLADATQIHQVLMNLGTNAWHAMKDRPGRLQVKLETRMVDEAYAATQVRLRPGLFARISVSDTGSGIEPGTLRRIFEPFFTTKPVGEGTGLGLSVVHGIMASHDGAITVYSQPGEGTVFHLYFPAHSGNATTLAADEGPTPVGNGEQVLFVDDEALLVQLAKKTLTALGYSVEVAQNPAAALELVRAEPARFSIVITDQTMPGMTGLMLASELKRIRPGLPIILMTGYGLALVPERIRAAGIHKCLIKPTTVHSLGTAVHSALMSPISN